MYSYWVMAKEINFIKMESYFTKPRGHWKREKKTAYPLVKEMNGNGTNRKHIKKKADKEKAGET